MEEKEQATKTEEVTSFREAARTVVQSFSTGWNWLVVHMCQLFGIGKDAARNTLLIAGASLLTASVQIVNWVYLYVHYHIGYNVPVAYLTAETSWLVSFGVGVLLVVAFGFISSCLDYFSAGRRTFSVFGLTIAFVVLLLFLLCAGPNGDELLGLLVGGLIWLLFALSVFGLLFGKKGEALTDTERKPAIRIMVVLDALVILFMCIWWLRGSLPDFLTRWDLAQDRMLFIWGLSSFCVYSLILFWSIYLVDCSALRKGTLRAQVVLVFVATVFVFFLMDDSMSRDLPYAVTASSQQVVVYQSKEISVLEAATITEDEDTGYVTLIIDTSQQQIVDSATLSYEYRTFNEVEID